mmetsp:Transcript_13633/g.36504  ORF Transcript_13633/g.36504 Transcript_13633/m.36504 type:complete len:344 (-) Transcript_13633:424-1455(-)
MGHGHHGAVQVRRRNTALGAQASAGQALAEAERTSRSVSKGAGASRGASRIGSSPSTATRLLTAAARVAAVEGLHGAGPRPQQRAAGGPPPQPWSALRSSSSSATRRPPLQTARMRTWRTSSALQDWTPAGIPSRRAAWRWPPLPTAGISTHTRRARAVGGMSVATLRSMTLRPVVERRRLWTRRKLWAMTNTAWTAQVPFPRGEYSPLHLLRRTVPCPWVCARARGPGMAMWSTRTQRSKARNGSKARPRRHSVWRRVQWQIRHLPPPPLLRPITPRPRCPEAVVLQPRPHSNPCRQGPRLTEGLASRPTWTYARKWTSLLRGGTWTARARGPASMDENRMG